MGEVPVLRRIRVGILEGVGEISGSFLKKYFSLGREEVSGPFKISVKDGLIAAHTSAGYREYTQKEISFRGFEDSAFELNDYPLGRGFHWEVRKRTVFPGDLIVTVTEDGSMCVINEVDIEDYVKIVVLSEMNPSLPKEYLKVHAIISRSWLFSTLKRKREEGFSVASESQLKFYDSRVHKFYDVCSEDHCQRYHGIQNKVPREVDEALRETEGIVLKYGDEICDTRYSKCCGGLTEEFQTAWEERTVPYLVSVPCSLSHIDPVRTEEEAERWVKERPEVFCNVTDPGVISLILNRTDLNTKEFFRWNYRIGGDELTELIKQKSGIDIGQIKDMKPLERGPSGRIKRLLIEGERNSLIVGKELEIRRILSRSHLLSSAFKIILERDRRGYIREATLIGAGWGHGVGLCQIGAASMAFLGFNYVQILKHYYRGSRPVNIYEEGL